MVFLLHKGGFVTLHCEMLHIDFLNHVSFFPEGIIHLSSWLIDLRVINYTGTFQFGLEETPTHQTHRGGLPICRSDWNMWAITFFPPRLWKKKAHIPIKVWHHQSACICFIPSDYPRVADCSFLIRKKAPASSSFISKFLVLVSVKKSHLWFRDSLVFILMLSELNVRQ